MFGSIPGWQGAPGQTSPLLDPDLIGGIAAYRRHPWQRDLPEPPSIWREGATRLLDYTLAAAPRPARRRREPPRLLFVPSLVNRGYVLDLAPGRSMLRWFAQEGFRPLLLEWDAPDEAARHFTLTDYIAGRLERALAACGAPVVLVGYCMGGLLALAAALRRPEHVAALVLLAVPWDFHAAGPELPLRLAATLPALEPAMALRGTLPVDALQALFALADADGIAARYRGFARLDPDSERARAFVALEDWLSDGVALSAPVARECLGDWYGRNTPGRLAWRVAGEVVDPARLRLPSFVALPGRDRIVPPATAQTLADLIPGAVAHRPAAGHIGMAAGSSAETALWQPLARWLRGLQVRPARRR